MGHGSYCPYGKGLKNLKQNNHARTNQIFICGSHNIYLLRLRSLSLIILFRYYNSEELFYSN